MYRGKYIRGIRAPLRSLSKAPNIRDIQIPCMRILCGMLLMQEELLSTTVQRPLGRFSCAHCSTLLLLLLLQVHLLDLRHSNICLGRVRPNFVLLAVGPCEFPHLLVILNQVLSSDCSESWISEQTTPHGKHMSTSCVANSVEQSLCLMGSDECNKLITTTSH